MNTYIGDFIQYIVEKNKHNNNIYIIDFRIRVGRTARQGRDGIAISIFRFPRDLKFLAQIESIINTKLVEHKVDRKKINVKVKISFRLLVHYYFQSIQLKKSSFK